MHGHAAGPREDRHGIAHVVEMAVGTSITSHASTWSALFGCSGSSGTGPGRAFAAR
jgi:hypothetical protein